MGNRTSHSTSKPSRKFQFGSGKRLRNQNKMGDKVSPEEEVQLFHPRKRRPSDLSIQTLLQEPIVSNAFRNFMLEKFSEAFVSLWTDLYNYERIPYESPTKRSRAQEIYSKFFDERSSFFIGRSEHIDQGTIENLRGNLVIGSTGMVQQTDMHVLSEAFKFVYGKVLTILKFEFMPQFLVSENFAKLDPSIDISAVRPCWFLDHQDTLIETKLNDVELEKEQTAAQSLDTNLDQAQMKDATFPSVQNEAALQNLETADFDKISTEMSESMSMETFLSDPYLASYFIEFVHSDEIKVAIDFLVGLQLQKPLSAGKARSRSTGEAEAPLRKKKISFRLAATRRSPKSRLHLVPKSGSDPELFDIETNVQSLYKHSMPWTAVTSPSTSQQEHRSAQLAQIELVLTAALGSINELTTKERVLHACSLANAADLVELYFEIEDYRASESDPKHQFDRLLRILTQYGSPTGPISPPIDFLQHHFTQLEKKIARYRDVVYSQKDSHFFDATQQDILERLETHVLPLFRQSHLFAKMSNCANNLPNNIQAERAHDKIRRLAEFAEQRRYNDHFSYKYTLESALSLPWGAYYLKRFARKRLQEESVLFLLEVDALKNLQKKTMDKQIIASRVKRICETYVHDLAPLQINISHPQREAILRRVYQEEEYSISVLDEATEEVLRVLKVNLWPAFQQDSMHENFMKKCTHNLYRSMTKPSEMGDDNPLLRPVSSKFHPLSPGFASNRSASSSCFDNLVYGAGACPVKNARREVQSLRLVAPPPLSRGCGDGLSRSSSAQEFRPLFTSALSRKTSSASAQSVTTMVSSSSISSEFQDVPDLLNPVTAPSQVEANGPETSDSHREMDHDLSDSESVSNRVEPQIRPAQLFLISPSSRFAAESEQTILDFDGAVTDDEGQETS